MDASVYNHSSLIFFTALFSGRVLQRKRARRQRRRSQSVTLRPVTAKQTKQINNQPRMSQSTPLTIQILKLTRGQAVTSSVKKDTSTRTKAILYFSSATPTLTERVRRAQEPPLQIARVRDLCPYLFHHFDCIRGRWMRRYIIINHSSLIFSLHYFLAVFCSANVHDDNKDDHRS